jgi:hypothetical protein
MGNVLHRAIFSSWLSSGEREENRAELVPSEQPPPVLRNETYSCTLVTVPE